MKIEKKNSIVCDSCKNRIPAYVDTCPECGAFVRNRINNLNIWKTILNLFDSPVKTMTKIIYAKRKSGIFLIAFTFVLTLAFYDFAASNFLRNESSGIEGFLKIFESAIINYTITILSVSMFVKFIFYPLGYKARFKDIAAVSIFAFVPVILTSFFLFPIEVGLFGEYWFTFHPYPWVIKSFPAYLLLSIHGIMLLWSLALLFIGMKKIFRNNLISFAGFLCISAAIFYGQFIVVY